MPLSSSSDAGHSWLFGALWFNISSDIRKATVILWFYLDAFDAIWVERAPLEWPSRHCGRCPYPRSRHVFETAPRWLWLFVGVDFGDGEVRGDIGQSQARHLERPLLRRLRALRRVSGAARRKTLSGDETFSRNSRQREIRSSLWLYTV